MSPYVNVSSRTAGDASGKEHFHVLRNIRDAVDTISRSNESNFGVVNFIESSYTDPKGEPRPMYLLKRDTFTFIAMGNRGEEAAESNIGLLLQLQDIFFVILKFIKIEVYSNGYKSRVARKNFINWQ